MAQWATPKVIGQMEPRWAQLIKLSTLDGLGQGCRQDDEAYAYDVEGGGRRLESGEGSVDLGEAIPMMIRPFCGQID